MSFKRISVTDARSMMAEASDDVQIVDIRDDESFAAGHIDSAFHLHNSNLQQFMTEADPDKPLLVYCYHGHMSQGAAAYLAEQGFADTYSLDGGFQAWSEEESAD